MLGGPDMNISLEDIRVVVEAVRQRCQSQLRNELTLLSRRVENMRLVTAESYDRQLRSIETEPDAVKGTLPKIPSSLTRTDPMTTSRPTRTTIIHSPRILPALMLGITQR